MSTWTLIILAIGLSADAFAVSIGKGLQLRHGVAKAAVILGAAFGFAQAFMPVLGWFLGSMFADRVSRFAPWIAFVLLAAIGGKMLWEALRADVSDSDGDVFGYDSAQADSALAPPAGAVRGHGLRAAEVVMMAIATSIDALAVGASLAILDVSIWWTSAVIGLITFSLSVLAVFLGHSVGTRFRTPAEVAGGLILIGIGIRVLIS